MPELIILCGVVTIIGASFWFDSIDDNDDQLVAVVLYFVAPLWIIKALSHGRNGFPPICAYVLGWLMVIIGWLWAEHPA